MTALDHLTQATYLVAAILFVFSLRWLSSPKTARQGVAAGVGGMIAAVVGTLLHPEIVNYTWIVVALVVGTAIGVPLSWVPLTAVPQRTALSHAFGGLAAGLVGTAKYMLWLHDGELTSFRTFAIVVEVLLGFLTFTGSLMAAGKLQEVLPTRPLTYKNQNIFNFVLLAIAIGAGLYLVVKPEAWQLFPVVVVTVARVRRAADPADRRRRHADRDLAAELVCGPVGGGDGVRARQQTADHGGRAGRVLGLHSVGDHVQGDEPLVHERAVRRLRTGVTGAGGDRSARREERHGARRGRHPREREQRRGDSGYGMAVAQAQHRVRELYDQLSKRGIDCKFAIHPVAGRMPGHMNVLLAEAEVPYTALAEMDDINPDMPQVDVAIVVGANDVVNPAARHDKTSPIYGMPIINADRARTVVAIKRTMNPGFAGIENELYYADNCLMAFGDAKAVLGDIVKALSGDSGIH